MNFAMVKKGKNLPTLTLNVSFSIKAEETLRNLKSSAFTEKANSWKKVQEKLS